MILKRERKMLKFAPRFKHQKSSSEKVVKAEKTSKNTLKYHLKLLIFATRF